LLLSVFLPISVSFALGIAISGAVWSWTAALFSFRAMRLFLTSMWVGCLLLGMGSLASNARSSPSREAGRKIRVLVWGTVAGLIPAVVLDAASLYTGKVLLEYPFWMVTITVMAMFLFPISFAYAVVKHRVLEIPILLKRSARYLLVQRGFVLLTVLWGTAFTGLFISVALKLAHLLPRNPELALWTIAAAAVSFGLVLALAGARLHERVTRRIDRAFFRIAYDARVILQGLSDQVRTASDRGELAGRLGQEILSALHPQSLAVYFERGPGKLEIQRGNAPGQLATLSTDLPELVELARLAKPWDVPLDAAGNPKFPVLELLRPECLVPLLVREGRLIGLLVLGPRLSEEPYSGEDKALLASVAGQAAIALENIRLAEQIAVRMEAEQRAAHDMEIARQVQARLFPQKLPALRTLDYAGGCIQAREVGGDYYDFLELGPRRVALVLADIAGKGISGALLMANLQANLRSQYAVALDDPARLLASVNHLFYENTADASYATLFFADYSDATRELRYVNCGHNPPFLIRADGRVERLRATATVLGLFEDWECSVATALLNPRDLLVIYTDGITEASSQTGEEFGEDRLGGLLLAHRNDSARGLLDTIVNAVKQFSGSEQSDDLTLVIACAQELV
jgi:sigma-B regulation protein RsbU (phosphoserine phosphatase)